MLRSNDVNLTFMNECVNSYAKYVFNICVNLRMQEKETITSNRFERKFPALWVLFLLYLGSASVLRKQSPGDQKIPSASVTAERFL